MRHALVTTTINIPYNLEAYAKDFREHGPETEIIIAGDRYTNPECEKWCNDRGFYYMSPEEQTKWLKNINLHEYEQFLPWNCVQRRNVAILYAYRNGAEVIATIDDDNLWNDAGYFEQHEIGIRNFWSVETKSGWYNPCSLLQEENRKVFYPRGYSFSARSGGLINRMTFQQKKKIVVNAGLWTGDPDIDAVTRLAVKPNVECYVGHGKIALGPNAKCPFNSQNTALHRDVIPAYCLATGVGRYDDIIASYVVSRIANHLGDYISFGRPIVHQTRNPHDLYRDFDDELLGMHLIDLIVDWLWAIPLTKTTYKDCVAELIMDFEQKIEQRVIQETYDKFCSSDHFAFLRSIVRNYRYWMAVT